MGLPKSIRFEKELEYRLEQYLKTNRIKFSQLVTMALDKFISETQTIQLVPATNDQWMKATKKAMKEHKHAMDKLK